MNDHLEGLWFDRVVEKVMAEEISEENKTIFHPILKQYRDISATYGFCTSENGDLLSQWRAYADDGRGFAIGIDRQYFEWVKAEHSIKTIQVQKVTYDLEQQEEELRASDGFKKICDALDEDQEGADHKKIVNKIHSAIISNWRDLFYKFKNPAFSEEAEHRIIAPVPDKFVNSDNSMAHLMKHLSNIQLRVQSDHLASYLPLPLAKTDDNLLPYIRNIVLGPKNQTYKDELEYWLSKNGVRECVVTRSEASYR
ncbi:DUF2971 domain-containing protein [Terasakiella sp.]|uniref:DUF2971 domain-containing protein n=1 Tax=Terasakiella sp. TaxID=2034861 RepID=UPI003AA87DE0